MFFRNGTNMNRLGKNKEAVLKLTDGRNESEKFDLIMEIMESMYGEYAEIRKFLDFIRKHRKEVFLYLKNPGLRRPLTWQNSISQYSHGSSRTDSRQRMDS